MNKSKIIYKELEIARAALRLAACFLVNYARVPSVIRWNTFNFHFKKCIMFVIVKI